MAVAVVEAPSAARPANGALVVQVSGFASHRGQLMLAVHESKATFLTRKAPFRAAVVPIGADTVTYRFADIPRGRYAVAAFHDENGNGDLDGVLRVPRERYGFSRSNGGRFGPPSFDETAFEFGGTDTTIVIALRSALGN
jgi:uncharacterized protein (DUF2141 family)